MNVMIKKGAIIALMFVVLLTIVACNKTTFEESNNIIEVSDLEKQLSKDNVVVIDARSEEDYAKGHLAGAINLTTGELSISDPVPGIIAPKEQIESVLGSKGIHPDSDVFIYDNKGGIFAARIWWVMKVYGHTNVKVINGGEVAIVKEGLELSMDIPNVEKTEYIAKDMDTSMIATLDDVLEVVEGIENAKILDVRSNAEYAEGTIPTSILYPHTKNLYADGTFKSARDTYNDYTDLGLMREDTIILFCKSSVRATQTALLLEEAGYENLIIYDGAWLQWSTKDVPTEEQSDEVVVPSASDGS